MTMEAVFVLAVVVLIIKITVIYYIARTVLRFFGRSVKEGMDGK